MRLTKFVHSCVLVTETGGSLLFDPGKFSFVEGRVRPEQFTGLTAIVLTHNHPDHLALDALATIVAANPHAEILGNAESVATLAAQNIAATVLEDGSRTVGPFFLEAMPASHALILGSDPPSNTAFRVNRTLLNPGDSFSPVLDRFAGTPALMLPVMAPWMRELEAADFGLRMRPAHILPVHDGQSRDFFLKLRYATFGEHFAQHNIQFAQLIDPGASVDV